MRRREFLYLSAAVPATALAAWPRRLKAVEPQLLPGWRTFEIVTSVEVAAPSGHTQLWLPLPASVSSEYQRLLSTDWDAQGASHAELAVVPGYDVQLLHVNWSDAAAVRPVTLTHRVATRDRRVNLDAPPPAPARAAESASTLKNYLRPTTLLPTDGIVRTTAQHICEPRRDEIDKARALYEWVVENTARDPKIPGCGMGDVGSMLRSGYLGGKCADINALFVGSGSFGQYSRARRLRRAGGRLAAWLQVSRQERGRQQGAALPRGVLCA